MARDFTRRNFLRGAATLLAGVATGGAASVLPAVEAAPVLTAGSIVYGEITLNKLAVVVFMTEEMLADDGRIVESFVSGMLQSEMNRG